MIISSDCWVYTHSFLVINCEADFGAKRKSLIFLLLMGVDNIFWLLGLYTFFPRKCLIFLLLLVLIISSDCWVYTHSFLVINCKADLAPIGNLWFFFYLWGLIISSDCWVYTHSFLGNLWFFFYLLGLIISSDCWVNTHSFLVINCKADFVNCQ